MLQKPSNLTRQPSLPAAEDWDVIETIRGGGEEEAEG